MSLAGKNSDMIVIDAWIELGSKRRETRIETPREEIMEELYELDRVWPDASAPYTEEDFIPNYVWNWIFTQFRAGWSGADFGSRDTPKPEALSVTLESVIPTERSACEGQAGGVSTSKLPACRVTAIAC